jgi:capsular polysaccharide biosynthesis protein
MALDQYMRVLRARWMTVYLTVALGIAVAAVLAVSHASTYAATTQLFLSVAGTAADREQAYDGVLFAQHRARSYAEILSGPAGAQAVIDRLGLSESVPEVERRIRVAVRPDGVLIDVTANDEAPEEAMAMANALTGYLVGLARRLDRVDEDLPSPLTTTVTRPAQLPTERVAPRTPAYLALGVLLGMAVGVAAAVLQDAAGRRISSRRGPASVPTPAR